MVGRRLIIGHVFAFVLIIIIGVSTLAFLVPFQTSMGSQTPKCYVGVAFGGNTTLDAKMLIDKVKSYTNLFVLDTGSSPISWNETAVNEVCDYAVAQGLSIIINLGWINRTSWFWKSNTFDDLNVTVPHILQIKQQWNERWGDKFLGVYYNDEPGGTQIDGAWPSFWTTWIAHQPPNGTLRHFDNLILDQDVWSQDLNKIYAKIQAANTSGVEPTDYDLEAKYFVNDSLMGDLGLASLNAANIPTFTSDYALYWWDYLGGFDVVLAQLGWNNSYVQQIDMVSGAAHLQNKDWGVMLTWKYDQTPYLDTGYQIYQQMVASYQAGAKYIIIFDYPQADNNNYGVMRDEHFFAMQTFWNDMTVSSKIRTLPDPSKPYAALVLPKNYGWGMRRPDDGIWGFWDSDSKSIPIGTITGQLLSLYGLRLDIVFQDPAFPVTKGDYTKIYYWNSTL